MSAHLISECGLIAAEDAYDAIATGSYEQINRRGIEAAIKAYLAADPVIAAAPDLLEALRKATALVGLCGRMEDASEDDWRDFAAQISDIETEMEAALSKATDQ